MYIPATEIVALLSDKVLVQLESEAQKKLLQYGMVGTLLSLAASHQLYGLQASVLAIPALNIAAAWYACYGAAK